MNAICERLIGTLHHELLDRILFLYNGHRPHESRHQRPPDIATQSTRDVTDLNNFRSIRRKHVVAGAISEYHHAA
jgi:hypothetical protein